LIRALASRGDSDAGIRLATRIWKYRDALLYVYLLRGGSQHHRMRAANQMINTASVEAMYDELALPVVFDHSR